MNEVIAPVICCESGKVNATTEDGDKITVNKMVFSPGRATAAAILVVGGMLIGGFVL